jgi:hypothetical protein
MAFVEVIQNPVATVGVVLVLLVAVTAIAFLAVLVLCGFRPDELDALEGE